MKKIIINTLVLLASMGLFAQQQSNSISVNGIYNYTISPEYSLKMVVSLNNVYYDAQTITLEEIKSDYLDKLAKNGIDISKIKEDDLAYHLYGYEKKGTILEFKTKSLEAVKKFLSIKSLGVLKSDTFLRSKISAEKRAEYAKAAYDNAKQKAESLAKKINRKVGKAIAIQDSNPDMINESLYYSSARITEKEYHISVSFELL